jgi:predicted CoA-binding protein
LSKDVIKEVLNTCKTIAVVGLLREPEKDSYQVTSIFRNMVIISFR